MKYITMFGDIEVEGSCPRPGDREILDNRTEQNPCEFLHGRRRERPVLCELFEST